MRFRFDSNNAIWRISRFFHAVILECNLVWNPSVFISIFLQSRGIHFQNWNQFFSLSERWDWSILLDDFTRDSFEDENSIRCSFPCELFAVARFFFSWIICLTKQQRARARKPLRNGYWSNNESERWHEFYSYGIMNFPAWRHKKFLLCRHVSIKKNLSWNKSSYIKKLHYKSNIFFRHKNLILFIHLS